MSEYRQLTLDAAPDAKQKGQNLAYGGASALFVALALDAIREAALMCPEITSDEVRPLMSPAMTAPSNGTWGAVWAEAARRGWVTPTDRVRTSTRKAARGHRNAIWHSAIWQKGAA